MQIERVDCDDFSRLWPIIEPVVRAGRTYPYGRDWTESRVKTAWCAPGAHCYAACSDPATGAAAGCFYIKPNALGPGSHVANAGFVTAQAARGQGVGRAMGAFAVDEARRLGFRAMQFNMVVATNTASLRLWKRLGFSIVGTVPKAFDDAEAGLVDIHIMHRAV